MRVTVKDTAGVPVDSWSDYYPFGKTSRSSSSINAPKEQYNGKQRDYETGIDYYGMRYYNTEIARFITVDPLTQSFPELTPYQYASNNPVSNIDLDGLEGYDFNKLVKTIGENTRVSISAGITIGREVSLPFIGHVGGEATVLSVEISASFSGLWNLLSSGGDPDLALEYKVAHGEVAAGVGPFDAKAEGGVLTGKISSTKGKDEEPKFLSGDVSISGSGDTNTHEKESKSKIKSKDGQILPTTDNRYKKNGNLTSSTKLGLGVGIDVDLGSILQTLAGSSSSNTTNNSNGNEKKEN